MSVFSSCARLSGSVRSRKSAVSTPVGLGVDVLTNEVPLLAHGVKACHCSRRSRRPYPRAFRVRRLMAAFIRAIALDLEGTLDERDRLSKAAMVAVDEIRDGTLVAVLGTGRILTELDAASPGLSDRFDAAVAENGAVLALGDEVPDLTEPVEEALSTELTNEDVTLRRSRVLLAGDTVYSSRRRGRPSARPSIARSRSNRGALMIVPAGVSKATGLQAALNERGISAHNSLALGDAGDDLALLPCGRDRVAVANAVVSPCATTPISSWRRPTELASPPCSPASSAPTNSRSDRRDLESDGSATGRQRPRRVHPAASLSVARQAPACPTWLG